MMKEESKKELSHVERASKGTTVQKSLAGIGFNTQEGQDHFLAALIARGVFTDTPVSAKPRFTDTYEGRIDKIRHVFTSSILKGREINSLSYEEILECAHTFTESHMVGAVLGDQLATSKFFLGVMQDFALNAGGVSQTVVSEFSDRAFGDLASPFTPVQQRIFDFFKGSAKTAEEVKALPESSNIAIFGTAGENFKQRLKALGSILEKPKGTENPPTVHYTSNARYFLSFENDMTADVISNWFSKELAERATPEVMEAVRTATLKILDSEQDFTKNNDFDKVPKKILAAVNTVLGEKGIVPIGEWPGDKHSLIAKDAAMRTRYQECEALQNTVRAAREGIADIPAITRRSTATMPTPFDYIQMSLESRFPEVAFNSNPLVFKKFTKSFGEISVPDIMLCNTFDEINSYRERGIRLDLAVTDSDNLLQQKQTAEESKNVGDVTYAEMPKHNFANFVMSLSKSLYGACNGHIRNLEEQQVALHQQY